MMPRCNQSDEQSCAGPAGTIRGQQQRQARPQFAAQRRAAMLDWERGGRECIRGPARGLARRSSSGLTSPLPVDRLRANSALGHCIMPRSCLCRRAAVDTARRHCSTTRCLDTPAHVSVAMLRQTPMRPTRLSRHVQVCPPQQPGLQAPLPHRQLRASHRDMATYARHLDRRDT